MKYFKEKPYRIFYLVFFVLIYFSALLQGVTPLGSLKMPVYVPEKVRIDLRGSLNGAVQGYFAENFLYPRGLREGWMRNHGLVVLNNLSPTDLKMSLSFQALSFGRERSLRISSGKRVLKTIRLGEKWQIVTIPEFVLEPGELLLYFYTPEGTQPASNLGLKEDTQVSAALKEFSVEPRRDYSSAERLRIIRQKFYYFINSINYVYTSVIAFVLLLIAFLLHARSALSVER